MRKGNISEEKRKNEWQRIQQFCLMDDEFMTKVFEDDVACTELVLRVILNKDDLNVKTVRTQYTIKNLQGRSVRLDIYADDSKKKKYNIEVQKDDEGASPKRARFHGSILDSNALHAGEGWKDLSETYIIFITENDIF